MLQWLTYKYLTKQWGGLWMKVVIRLGFDVFLVHFFKWWHYHFSSWILKSLLQLKNILQSRRESNFVDLRFLSFILLLLYFKVSTPFFPIRKHTFFINWHFGQRGSKDALKLIKQLKSWKEADYKWRNLLSSTRWMNFPSNNEYKDGSKE